MDHRKITIGAAEGLIGAVAAGSVSLLAWIAVTMYELNAQVQVMAVKVEQSHEMIRPLWEDYIRRTAEIGGWRDRKTAGLQ